MHRRALNLAVCLVLSVALVSPASGAGAPKIPTVATDDLIHIGPDYNGGRPLPVRGGYEPTAAEGETAARVKVGKRKQWLAIDDATGAIYFKRFKLRGKGKHIEIWVANDQDQVSRNLRFPEGDCRNDERVHITDRQVKYFIRQFDRNMYPKESRAFSRPPDRGGKRALLYDPRFVQPPFPRGYYKGDKDNIVVLVDNVRDENFYDTDNQSELPYIGGFFFSIFNELHARNIMTIDSYDWRHRTRANPPHEPVPGDPCRSKPARPFGYESTFAHEYQHLLEYYEDRNETIWINEGLSMWAETLTGYATPEKLISQRGHVAHIQCFLGWLEQQTEFNPNPDSLGGPENSLNLWEEQEQEILCDYGAAYTMMELLQNRHGNGFMKRLHRRNANGFVSLDRLLSDAAGKTTREVIHEWLAMVALDGILDDGATLSAPAGVDEDDLTARTLNSTINWDNTDAYSEPGAPPNGADFVRLRDASGGFLEADEIDSISFDGAETLPSLPVEWTVDATPPERGNDPALYSGSGPMFDRAIVQEVSVPQQAATLTFETFYETEEAWDFGFVQVSTDGGRTYTSLANADTTSNTDPQAIEPVRRRLPGFTGNSGCPEGSQLDGGCAPSWVTQTFDLSAYAGQDILLAFRYVTDPAIDLPGWWIDEVSIENKKISQGATVNDWQSESEAFPAPVEGFTVQLIAYDDAHTQAAYTVLPLGQGFNGTLEGEALEAWLLDGAQVVAALVTYDEPTEKVTQYAPYLLQVDGVTQPGGE